jgi:hypothetical protein
MLERRSRFVSVLARVRDARVNIGACVALCLGVLSCQHFDRAKECRSVSGLVNPVLRQIAVDVQKAPESGDTYRNVALKYEQLAAAVVALRPQNHRVLDAVMDYVKLAREAAHDARLFAEALDSKDPGRIAAARGATGRTMKHEGAALSHFDGVCRLAR